MMAKSVVVGGYLQPGQVIIQSLLCVVVHVDVDEGIGFILPPDLHLFNLSEVVFVQADRRLNGCHLPSKSNAKVLVLIE